MYVFRFDMNIRCLIEAPHDEQYNLREDYCLLKCTHTSDARNPLPAVPRGPSLEVQIGI